MVILWYTASTVRGYLLRIDFAVSVRLYVLPEEEVKVRPPFHQWTYPGGSHLLENVS